MVKLIINNIIEYGSIGGMVFLFIIFLVGRSGLADAVRDEEGHFRKKITVKSIFGFLLMILFILSLLFLGNKSLINDLQNLPAFHILCLNAFGIFFFVMLVDLIILDYLIIVRWHPNFLKLPNTDYYTKFKPHFNGFVRGQLLGIIFSVLVSMLSISCHS